MFCSVLRETVPYVQLQQGVAEMWQLMGEVRLSARLFEHVLSAS